MALQLLQLLPELPPIMLCLTARDERRTEVPSSWLRPGLVQDPASLDPDRAERGTAGSLLRTCLRDERRVHENVVFILSQWPVAHELQ